MLAVQDVHQSLSFYCDILGFEQIGAWGEGDDLYWAMARLGKAEVMFTRHDEITPTKRPTVLYWYPEDLRAYRDELADRGVAVPEIRLMSWGMCEFRLRDPDDYELIFGADSAAVGMIPNEFHQATYDGDVERMAELLAEEDWLLESKGFIYDWTGDHWRPMHIAAGTGNIGTLEFLLEKGADPEGGERIAPDDWSPIQLAVTHHPQVARFMAKSGARPDLFTHAALGNVNEVGRLLRANPKLVNRRGPDGCTLLHFAAHAEQWDMVKILLKAGADPSLRETSHGMDVFEWSHGGEALREILAKFGHVV